MRSEVVPVTIKTRKGVEIIDKDEEFTRIDLEKFKKLKTVFQKGNAFVRTSVFRF